MFSGSPSDMNLGSVTSRSRNYQPTEDNNEVGEEDKNEDEDEDEDEDGNDGDGVPSTALLSLQPKNFMRSAD